jgi:hypothetical protein
VLCVHDIHEIVRGGEGDTHVEKSELDLTSLKSQTSGTELQNLVTKPPSLQFTKVRSNEI